MVKRTPDGIRKKYLALTGGRSFDEDVQTVSLEVGSYFSDAEELLANYDQPEAIETLRIMMAYRKRKTRFFPNDKKVAKAIAESLYNTLLTTVRVRPFYDSTVLYSQSEAQEVLGQYGNQAGNPLAFMFADDLSTHCTVPISTCSLGITKKNGGDCFAITKNILTAYDVKQRNRYVNVHYYAPVVWGLLEREDFDDEWIETLKPMVETYLNKITSGKYDQE